ncbi:hypothetical protein ABZ667_39960 [Streptomyces lavendulae]
MSDKFEFIDAEYAIIATNTEDMVPVLQPRVSLFQPVSAVRQLG